MSIDWTTGKGTLTADGKSLEWAAFGDPPGENPVIVMLHEGLGFGWCEVGYSGVTFPLVEPCLRHVTRLGYRRVVVFPYFLFTGILVDRIYGFTDRVAADHPEIEFLKAGYLNDHDQVIATFAARVRELDSTEAIPNCGICAYREQVLSFDDGGHRHITPEQRRHHTRRRRRGRHSGRGRL